MEKTPRQSFGHVVKNKGVFELVEACKQIPNIQLKMVGQVFPEVKKRLNISCRKFAI